VCSAQLNETIRDCRECVNTPPAHRDEWSALDPLPAGGSGCRRFPFRRRPLRRRRSRCRNRRHRFHETLRLQFERGEGPCHRSNFSTYPSVVRSTPAASALICHQIRRHDILCRGSPASQGGRRGEYPLMVGGADPSALFKLVIRTLTGFRDSLTAATRPAICLTVGPGMHLPAPILSLRRVREEKRRP